MSPNHEEDGYFVYHRTVRCTVSQLNECEQFRPVVLCSVSLYIANMLCEVECVRSEWAVIRGKGFWYSTTLHHFVPESCPSTRMEHMGDPNIPPKYVLRVL